MTNVVFTDDASSWTETKPTANLRWRHGVLEQEFEVRRFRHGCAVLVEGEWRPVPQASPTPQHRTVA